RGQELFGRARTGYDALSGLNARYVEVAAETEPHLPYWRRTKEIAVFDSLRTLESQITRDLNDATTALYAAIEQAPDQRIEIAAKRRLEGLYRYLGQMGGLALKGDIRAYEELASDLGVGTYAAELDGGATVVFQAPRCADVNVFRYEDVEGRLTPLAFSPISCRIAEPVLVVERVLYPDLPFLPGDLVHTIDDVSVRTESDFAHAVEASAPEDTLRVELRRAGQLVTVNWLPRRLPDDSDEFGEELVDFRQQLGFWFQAYPLRPQPWTRVAHNTPLAFPKGSYLAYVTAPGHASARVPFVASGVSDTVRLRLPLEADIPSGFELVHEGYAGIGGLDQDYLQALPAGRVWVNEFAMARHEVTVRDYFEFLNAPETRNLIDENGRMRPKSPEGAAILTERSDASQSTVGPMETFQVVPSRIATRASDGSWSISPESPVTSDWPVVNVTLLGALEFAHWLTERCQGRWNFRIPTDVEWEKAARGVDRRTYVWGDYLMWPYCYNPRGHLGTSYPVGTGLIPYDESVYGIRDMEGSADEWTVTRTVAGLPYRSRRGGDWNTTDDYRFKLETRVGTFPERTSSANSLGFRLVTDLRTQGTRMDSVSHHP
ncbi:MAG: SUMF1/EgtB/PvdO family nonheme iron enzyme, partial [Candidatus Eisenbacteria bacterium]|nr:SUMF1/EgtB/PvdO family nonheme iron enzyme [Candidatus Eisenbacteria bacterium]